MSNAFQTVTPPRTGEVPAALKALVDVSAFQAITGAGMVAVRHIDDLPKLTDTKAIRCVIMERGAEDGGQAEALDRVEKKAYQLRMDCKKIQGIDPYQALAKAHAVAFSLLEGISPSLTLASVVHPLRRAQKPGIVLENEKENYYFQSAVYHLVLKAA